MTKVESYEHKLLFGLLGAYLAMSACSGASSQGNGESEVASIKIADLKDQDYDVVKLEISKVGQGESYKSSKTFQKGVESIEEKLPVGTYQFAIDYYKGQQKSLSSSYCSEEQKKTQTHTLAVGENKIKVLVCKLNKEPVNDEADVVIEPTLPPEDGVVPTLGGEGPSGDCDPKFLAPFCKDERINGFDEGTWKRENPPSLEEQRLYSLKAVNFLRARTCLAPLQLDPKLNGIAEKAQAANSGHGYFIQNCMNATYGYGENCEAGWTQENIGAASGTSRTWKHGIHVPLCAMMEEPKGVGHRANIESPAFKRLGVSINANANGAYWFHEFGK